MHDAPLCEVRTNYHVENDAEVVLVAVVVPDSISVQGHIEPMHLGMYEWYEHWRDAFGTLLVSQHWSIPEFDEDDTKHHYHYHP
jgi:hypothetical protein